MSCASFLNDPAFKAQLLSNPVAALRDVGVPVPEGLHLQVVEDTETKRHLVLPVAPAQGELADSALEGVAGGSKYGDKWPWE